MNKLRKKWLEFRGKIVFGTPDGKIIYIISEYKKSYLVRIKEFIYKNKSEIKNISLSISAALVFLWSIICHFSSIKAFFIFLFGLVKVQLQ